MHAVSFLSMALNNRPDLGDPYFEDQPVAEIGFSFEEAVCFITTLVFQVWLLTASD
jgi:hypothetical protein